MQSVVRSFAFSIAALVITAVSAAAQGHSLPSIDGRLLREGVDTFNISFAGDVFGRGTMARARIGEQLLQVHSLRIAGGVTIVDSLFSDARSLRSLRQVRVVGDTVIEVQFRGDSAHVARRPSSDSITTQSLALDPNVYSSAALDAVVSGLPLEENFEAQLRFYYAPPSDRGVESINITVAAHDMVKDREGRDREAWVVLAETRSGGTVYWVDKATRSVLKFDTKEGRSLIEFRR
jgi:hypothetical protein